MECKSGSRASELLRFTELIDTLWNVNVGTVVYDGYPVKRINRYVIEWKNRT